MKVGKGFFVCPIQYECYFVYDASVTPYTKCNTVTDFEHAWKKESLHSIASIIGISLVYNNYMLRQYKVRYMLLSVWLVKASTTREKGNMYSETLTSAFDYGYLTQSKIIFTFHYEKFNQFPTN